MDVLGIGTFQQGIQVLANGLDVTGFSTFKTGVVVTGVATATSFVGNVAGDATGLVEVPILPLLTSQVSSLVLYIQLVIQVLASGVDVTGNIIYR